MSMSAFPWGTLLQTAAGPTVNMLADGDFNLRFGNTCWAGMKFDSDGDEYEFTPAGGYETSANTWLTTGASADVWVEFIFVSGNGGKTKWDNKANATRYNLTGLQSFYINQATSGVSSITGYFKMWDAASSGNLLDTSDEATWSATREDF